MSGATTTAEVKASVDVRPVRSQVFLVSIAVVAGIAVICGTGLLAFDKVAGWWFLLFAILLVGADFWAWTKSQSDVDLDESHPTKLALPDGATLSTDSRILRSPEGVKAIAQLFQNIISRRPLPEPAGLVDENTQILPDSKAEALALASQINSQTQATTNALLDALGMGAAVDPPLIQQTSGITSKGPDEPPPQNLNSPVIDSSDMGSV